MLSPPSLSLSIRSEYVFTFDNTFELHQDVDILNKMDLDCGLNSGKVSTRSIAEAKATLPKIFEPVIDGKGWIHSLNEKGFFIL